MFKLKSIKQLNFPTKNNNNSFFRSLATTLEPNSNSKKLRMIILGAPVSPSTLFL